MPLSTIITTANIVSRASVALPLPPYITAAMIVTSMPVTASVRTRVPSGSPSFAAMASAWRTAAKDASRITAKSHADISANQNGWDRSASHPAPKAMKSATVATQTTSGHSCASEENVVCPCF